MNWSHAHKTKFWYLLEVLFKISGDRPRHFYKGVPAPRGTLQVTSGTCISKTIDPARNNTLAKRFICTLCVPLYSKVLNLPSSDLHMLDGVRESSGTGLMHWIVEVNNFKYIYFVHLFGRQWRVAFWSVFCGAATPPGGDFYLKVTGVIVVPFRG